MHLKVKKALDKGSDLTLAKALIARSPVCKLSDKNKILRGSEYQTFTYRVVHKQAAQKVGKNKLCHTTLKYMTQSNKQRIINKA